jgi:hypothetical protein
MADRLDWPFPDPPNLATITVRQIVHGGQPSLLVSHDADDGCWQFLTGGEFEVEDGMVVSLQGMIQRDPSLTELAALPRGWRAWRERPDDPWQRASQPEVDAE